ncbi:recombinase family protein [Leucobacter chromiireducens]|uniref:recombinase family protein n=1 Tax=Leucobacter chromiireducens TaxID=283877 RepID=UPI0013DE45CD|nr:recombinase family protein [Leucobacter chromiireducens]
MRKESASDQLKVVVYARQSVHEEQGIKQQVDDCRAEAKRRGWRIVHVYEDDATSGSKERGPGTGWARMLKDFDDGAFDAVLVNDTDRLTRSLGDILELRPPKRDMRVLTVRGSIDTDDPTHDFSLKFLVLFAEREVKQKAQRTERYAVERRKLGHPTAGRTPHGYRWVPAIQRDERGTRYRVDHDEAADVKRIFEEFLAGAKLGQIARDLNTDGRRTRAEAQWGASTVRRVLMNPLYAALLPPSQETGRFDISSIDLAECAPGAWEPIIDEATVAATRGRLVGVKPTHSGTARRWLLSGLAVCAVPGCRRPVRAASGETHPTPRVDGSGRAPAKRYHAYRCVDGHFMRNGDIIDEFVKEVCILRLEQPDASDLLVAKEQGPDVGLLTSQRIALEKREESIGSLIARGKMSATAAEAALDELAEERRAVIDRIASAVRADPLADVVASGDARAWWEHATLARRRSVVDALMTVAIRRAGQGRRITTLEGAAETVGIEWREPAA